MSDLTIRPADVPDIASLSNLAAETFPLACPSHTTPEAIADFIATHLTEARFAEYLDDPMRRLVVAERVHVPRELVGYVMLISGEPADANAAAVVSTRPAIELSKFYTRAAEHGGGIAASLMQAVLASATEAGASTCWLGVNEENARAIRFYEKHGFRKVGRKHFTVGGRVEDDWVLERALG